MYRRIALLALAPVLISCDRPLASERVALPPRSAPFSQGNLAEFRPMAPRPWSATFVCTDLNNSTGPRGEHSAYDPEMTLLISALGGREVEGQRTASVILHFDAAKRLILYTEHRDSWWSPKNPRRTPLNISISTGITTQNWSRGGRAENVFYGIGGKRTTDMVQTAAESLWFHPALGIADTYARVMKQCAPSEDFRSTFEPKE